MTPEPEIPSPCTQVCTLDAQRRHCLGCARSLDEIVAWSRSDADFKRAVWRLLPARRAALGLAAVELPEVCR